MRCEDCILSPYCFLIDIIVNVSFSSSDLPCIVSDEGLLSLCDDLCTFKGDEIPPTKRR